MSSLKVLKLAKDIVVDDRVQFHVLESFEPLPVSPFDDQALGYQLIRQTIQSVFPEINIVAPGNGFISCGWREVGAGTVFYPMSTPPPPPQLLSLKTAGYFPSCRVSTPFPGVEVRKQTGKEQKQ